MQPSPAGHPVYVARISGCLSWCQHSWECKAAFHPCSWFTPNIPTSCSPLYCSPSFVPFAFERIPISGLTAVPDMLQEDCSMEVKVNPGVCQLRLDFLDFQVKSWIVALFSIELGLSPIPTTQVTSVWRWIKTSCPHHAMAFVVKMTVSW